MPLDASITSERVNSEFFDGLNREKSHDTNSNHKKGTLRGKLKFQPLKTFSIPKESVSIISGEESLSVPTISDITTKSKTLPKLSFKKIDQRKNSLLVQLSAQYESESAISATKTVPDKVKIIKVVKPSAKEE